MRKITFLVTIAMLAIIHEAFSQTAERARLQVIHNTADVALTAVDIYIDNVLIADGLSFRSATPFLDVPADVDVRIDIAPDSSTSASASIYSVTALFTPGSANVAVAHGYVSKAGYQSQQPFQLSIFDQGREVANVATTTDILIFNTLDDVPRVNIVVPPVAGGNINEDVYYRPTASGYYELIPAQYQIQVMSADNELRTSYRLPLASLRLHGLAVTVLPSGFLYPSLNSNGPAFGLFLVLPEGGATIPLDMISNNVFSFAEANILMHPNPVVDFITFEFPFATRNINAQIVDMMGREVRTHQNIDHRLDVSDLENGVYTINLEIDEKNFTDKFVKTF